MTFQTATFTAQLPETDVVGPYSPWPRRDASTTRHRLRAPIAAGAGVAGLGVLVHCAMPLMY